MQTNPDPEHGLDASEDAPEENERDDPSEPTFDVEAAARDYANASDRTAEWAKFTAEEQELLTAYGITGPLSADLEGFRASEGFDPVRAQAEVDALLTEVRRGDLDATPETQELLDELEAETQRPDGPARREALERAAYVLKNLRDQRWASRPFNPDGTTQRVLSDGTTQVVEFESVSGREREVARWTAEEVDRARAEVLEDNELRENMSHGEIAALPLDRMLAFAERFPERWEAAKRQASDRMDERQREVRGAAGIF